MGDVPFVKLFTKSIGLAVSEIYGSVGLRRFRCSRISDVACPVYENGVLLAI